MKGAPASAACGVRVGELLGRGSGDELTFHSPRPVGAISVAQIEAPLWHEAHEAGSGAGEDGGGGKGGGRNRAGWLNSQERRTSS